MADTLPTMDVPRHDIARDATYEVQVLALTLRKLIEDTDPGAEIAAAARGILTRISDLSDILYEAVINDDKDPGGHPDTAAQDGSGVGADNSLQLGQRGNHWSSHAENFSPV